MTQNKTSVVLLSLVVAMGCTQSPAGDKTRNIESEIQGANLADSDAPADSYTRHLAIQGSIGFGETVDGHYADGAYAAWLFTASAGARVSLDATATDGSDTVLALYGPRTGATWTGARPLAVNDDYHGSTNSHIDTRVSRAGTYLVVVREYADAPGNFSLTLACSGAECRAECGTADRCPTGSECHRVYCIRAPCPSYCEPIAPTPPSCPPNTLLCIQGSHYDGTPGVCACVPDACPPNRLLCIQGSHYDGTPGVCACVPDACPPNTRLCIQGTHYDGTPGVCACVADVTVCGGFRGQTCPANQYCNFAASAMCGYADQTGTCAARPQICPALVAPVCGCDGNTYGNYCHANQAGTSVLHSGACAPAA